MARDSSPKERQQKQLERKQGRRASYDRILIVSEGSKTEPNYFREIRVAHRLHTANVEVQPSELGTAPIQVVQYAQTLFEDGDRHKNIQRRAFEKVFAVFDRDDRDHRLAMRLTDGGLEFDFFPFDLVQDVGLLCLHLATQIVFKCTHLVKQLADFSFMVASLEHDF